MSKELVPVSQQGWRDRLRGYLAFKRANPATTKAFGSGWTNWVPFVREPYPGAWQSNVVVDRTVVPSNWAVFACVTLIANDIAKMPAHVMAYDDTTKIWTRVIKRRVLDIPNRYQLWPDFMRSWMFSLLLHGNTYVFRDIGLDGNIRALYVLDPTSCRPLVTPGGDVYYQISADNLSGIPEARTVPANLIIHDRINTLFHPLCGISPLWASGIAAMQGLAMQNNSAMFFQNMSRPGGILTAPGHISDESAARLKEYWEGNFMGDTAGKIAVVGDGLKYEPMATTAADAQLIEQLKFTGEMICATFHVPPYKLGIGQPPSVGNLSALNQQYYDQCLHPLVDSIERKLEIGVDIFFPEQVWLDTEELLRMDPVSRWDAYSKSISAGVGAPNEIRRKENLPPVPGGDTPYLQQQNYSLAELNIRAEADKRRAAKSENGEEEVQKLAMNGAQIGSLLSLIDSAAKGEIPAASASAAIKASFPNLSDAEVAAMIGPLANFEPKPTPTPPSAATPPAEEPPPDEGEDEAEEEDVPEEEVEEAERAFQEALK